MKSYTDLEQSKKLAEILPHESADAIYEYCGEKLETSKLIEKPIYWLVIKGFESCCRFSTSKKDIPCWSLAALLRVIPKQIKHFNTLQIDIKEKGFFIWYDYSDCGVNPELPHITKECAVDACVDMIEKLHKLKML